MMQNTEHTAAPLLVRGGRVHDAVHPEPQQIDLLLENGRIVAMGHELNVPADIAVLDCRAGDFGFTDCGGARIADILPRAAAAGAADGGHRR